MRHKKNSYSWLLQMEIKVKTSAQNSVRTVDSKTTAVCVQKKLTPNQFISISVTFGLNANPRAFFFFFLTLTRSQGLTKRILLGCQKLPFLCFHTGAIWPIGLALSNRTRVRASPQMSPITGAPPDSRLTFTTSSSSLQNIRRGFFSSDESYSKLWLRRKERIKGNNRKAPC